MEEKYCQSCGMPMGNTGEFYGTNAMGVKILNIAATVLIVESLLVR